VANYNDVRAMLGDAINVYMPSLATNTYSYVPRSIIPPALIVQPTPHRTIDYTQVEGRGTFALWRFNIMIVIGQVDEEVAQTQAGDIITPGSPLIRAIQDIKGNGYAQVLDGGISSMMFDQGLYTYAELNVIVKA
jgi:hypothetical protein